MNRKQLDDFRKDSAMLLDMRMRQNAKKNKCGFPGGLAHSRKIFEICYMLNGLGKKFFTEAVFKTGGKADIFVLDNRTAIEVLDTEKNGNIISKQMRYPCPIVQVRVEEKFVMEMIE